MTPETVVKKSVFETRHDEILANYGGDLPEPNSKLKVTTVINAYRELRNGNFFNFLRSASLQNADQSQWEILYIVNNYEDESGDGFEENQKHIRIIEAIGETRAMITDSGATTTETRGQIARHVNSLDLGLTSYEEEIMVMAVLAGVNIHAIDASSPGVAIKKKTDIGEMNPRGAAKNIGGHVALERGGSSVVIDYLDGDCFIPRNYIANLIKGFETGDVEFGVKELVPVLDSLPERLLEEKDEVMRLRRVIEFVRTHFIMMHLRYLTSRPYSSPMHAVSGGLFEKIGGYPENVLQEDFVFMGLLERETVAKPAGTHVYLSDRARVGSVDGSDRTKIDHNSRLDSEKNFARTFSQEDDYLRSFPYMVNLEGKLRQVEEIDRDFSGDKEYRNLRDNWQKRLNRQRMLTIRRFRDLVDGICATSPRMFDLIGVGVLGKSRVERIISELDLSSREEDQIRREPIIVDVLIHVRKLVNNPLLAKKMGVEVGDGSETDRIMSFLERYMPEQFATPTNPDYDANEYSGNFADYIPIIRAAFYYREWRRL